MNATDLGADQGFSAARQRLAVQPYSDWGSGDRLILRWGNQLSAIWLISILQLVASESAVFAQSIAEPLPPLCIHAESDAQANIASAAPSGLVSWSIIPNAAIELVYDSIYDVHTSFDPTQPIRSQPGGFHTSQILSDLECLVDPSIYNFVLIYSVQEVPGWIHAGPRGIQTPAQNIGFPNAAYGIPSVFAGWPKLYLAPHMNSVEFVMQDDPPDFGGVSAMHEMGHAWNVYWAMQSPGPREWKENDPVAWLASCCSHWSWNWVDPLMPGMMYSAPTKAKFNEFDLYAMGLMPYEEATTALYKVYEVTEDSSPGPTHIISLDDLIFSLSVEGDDFFEGNGRRFPATDPDVAELTALLVVVRGTDEILTSAQAAAIRDLAISLPQSWLDATDGRSSLTIAIQESRQVDADSDNVLDCFDNCPHDANPTQEDGDNDSVGDTCDPCPHVSLPSLWDLDHREGFNLHDFWVFQSCFSGDQPVTAGCTMADFSGGGQIDLSDYVPVGELMTGNCP